LFLVLTCCLRNQKQSLTPDERDHRDLRQAPHPRRRGCLPRHAHLTPTARLCLLLRKAHTAIRPSRTSIGHRFSGRSDAVDPANQTSEKLGTTSGGNVLIGTGAVSGQVCHFLTYFASSQSPLVYRSTSGLTGFSGRFGPCVLISRGGVGQDVSLGGLLGFVPLLSWSAISRPFLRLYDLDLNAGLLASNFYVLDVGRVHHLDLLNRRQV